MESFFSTIAESLNDPHKFFEVLLILMVAIWVSGRVFRAMKLPAVLGEILAGVLIGPAVLGIVPITETVMILADLGVFFLMFHTGLETNSKELMKNAKTSLMISVFAIIPLFSIGFYILYGLMDYSLLTSLFMAGVIPLNSIPVIISVLKSFNIHKSKIGHAALGATVANEMILFIVLSIILVVANTGSFSAGTLLFIIAKVILFFIITLFVGRKILPYLTFIFKKGKKGFTFAMIIALIFGLFAEAIGLHIILGAYLAGMFIREQIQNEAVMVKIEDRFYGISYSFLGPIFFAVVGMNVEFEILFTVPLFIITLLIMMLGFQWVGSTAAALLSKKFTFAEGSVISFALTGRGGTEIIIAKVGLMTIVAATGESLLPNELFSSVVMLAFLTTLVMPLFIKLFVGKLEREEHQRVGI